MRIGKIFPASRILEKTENLDTIGAFGRDGKIDENVRIFRSPNSLASFFMRVTFNARVSRPDVARRRSIAR